MPVFYSSLKAGARAFASFSVMQATQMLTPLIALPWLSRKLGPECFGLLMYMALIPPLAALFVDWGMLVGAAREAARSKDDGTALARLLGAVISAKLLLICACVLLAVLFFPFAPHARSHWAAYILAFCAGIARGANPVWFFQGSGCGIEKLALWDTGASLLTLGCTFAFIRQPDDWQLYLFFLALFRLAAYAAVFAGLCSAYRPRLNFGRAIAMLRACSPFFGSSFSSMVCYNGTQLVMGHWLPADSVGILAAANKMLRAILAMFLPLMQTLFPEFCLLARAGHMNRQKLARWYSIIILMLAAICAAVIWLLAPWLMAIALGPDYAYAGNIFRMLILALPFMACNATLAQIFAAAGEERRQFFIAATGAAASLPLAAMASMWWGIFGCACVPLAIEAALFCCYGLLGLKGKIIAGH